MKQIWTIKAVLEWTQGHFESKGTQNPRLEAQWIVAAATKLSRIELYTHYDQPLDQGQLAAVREGITRRLAGEPLQYITGKAAFRHLEFTVKPPVLIPRPETEVLVDTVLQELRVLSQRLPEQPSPHEYSKVIDIGTGSGCIALSLLYEAKNVRIFATDLNAEAVDIAVENAQNLGLLDPLRLTIMQDDVASSLLADTTQHATFDIIVSNPPYIPTDELTKLSNEIAKYESPLALDGGADGLNVFRRIVAQAKALLKPHGMLACELHEDTLERAQRHCEAEGFVDGRVLADLTGRPRILLAYMPT